MSGRPLFTHIVLTRFNVRMGFSAIADADPKWLEHRFGLFEQFCYPSLRSQSVQDFTWLVLFDKNTPAMFRERIDRYACWERFVPVFVESFNNTTLDALVREHIAPNSRYLITSRIDNDDAYCTSFLEEVRRTVDQTVPAVVNFSNGLLLDLVHGRLYRRRHSSNPFVSLIEEVGPEPLSTIWAAEHNQTRKLGTVRQIGGQPAWLMVIHDKNVSNRVVRSWQVPSSVLQSRFAINAEALPRSSRAGILMHNTAYMLRRLAGKIWRVFR